MELGIQKKITVYVVSATETGKQVTYATKSNAEKAMETLKAFGVEVTITSEKRTVTL